MAAVLGNRHGVMHDGSRAVILVLENADDVTVDAHRVAVRVGLVRELRGHASTLRREVSEYLPDRPVPRSIDYPYTTAALDLIRSLRRTGSLRWRAFPRGVLIGRRLESPELRGIA
jgi:hypothetical protein